MRQETVILNSLLSLPEEKCITRDDPLEGMGLKMSGDLQSHRQLQFTSGQWIFVPLMAQRDNEHCSFQELANELK